MATEGFLVRQMLYFDFTQYHSLTEINIDRNLKYVCH